MSVRVRPPTAVPDGLQKAIRIGNVLERMPTTYNVRFQVGVFVAVEILNERHRGIGGRGVPLGDIGGIDTDARIVAQSAHLCQEFPLAAADFENALLAYVVPVDQLRAQIAGECSEPAGEPLRLFIPSRVVVDSGIKACVRDETAFLTQAQLQLACRIRQGLLAVRDEQATVDRDGIDLIERQQALGPTIGTDMSGKLSSGQRNPIRISCCR